MTLVTRYVPEESRHAKSRVPTRRAQCVTFTDLQGGDGQAGSTPPGTPQVTKHERKEVTIDQQCIPQSKHQTCNEEQNLIVGQQVT